MVLEVSLDDLGRGEEFALSLMSELFHLSREKCKRPDQFWCGMFIALAAMAQKDLGKEAYELLGAAVLVGAGHPDYVGEVEG